MSLTWGELKFCSRSVNGTSFQAVGAGAVGGYLCKRHCCVDLIAAVDGHCGADWSVVRVLPASTRKHVVKIP